MVFQQRGLESGEDATYDGGGYDGDSGILPIPDQSDPSGSPSLRFRTAQLQHQLSQGLKQINPFAVSPQTKLGSAGLAIDVKGGLYRQASVEKTLPDTDAFALTDDATNWIFCDGSEIVEKDTSAWPSANHFKIAVVVTASGAITSVTPAVHLNHNPGVTDVWAATAADQDVDLAGFDLEDVGQLDFGASSELTIASGVITPTQVFHTVDGQGDADDDLDTITADAAKVGQIIILRVESLSRTITIKDGTGNIELSNNDDYVLKFEADALVLIQRDATTWVNLTRTDGVLPTMVTDIAFSGSNGIGLTGLGKISIGAATKTIATGSIDNTLRNAELWINTQASASSDDLDTVTGALVGDLLLIRPKTTDTVVVKHAVGADKFFLMSGIDYSMTTTERFLVCTYDGTQWVEVARSHHDGSELAGGAKAFPIPMYIRIDGNLVVSASEAQEHVVPYDMVIKSITGRVGTAPTSATLIVDLHVDGVSIFASQAEMINITTGTQQDTSAVKDTVVAAGSILRLEVEQVGSGTAGADLVVAIEAYAAAQTPR